ncbi:HAMP domain-containing histidine kinase [Flavobacterium sp. J49]|uniref:sensor histidine kinase n=1 Tax=Flavobacterium sp. J49 TaxID=2718534 RepID=UPI0015947AD7|nr:HAMP domain-containing sensor histidine kinase [Flavobacterium sp. J49]MBF6641211.1 HAMP domain-containing histidine kinase [Flavobacterium sp. J49]NIC02458.1 HAMP domain-containing histidine kinase [Flavobacterium sp. J49]
MQFSEKRNTTRWIIIMASFVIVALILWNTYSFFQIFKNEERLKMELWAKSQETLINANEYTDVDLPLQIIQTATIPIIVTEKDSIINTKNIDEDILKDKNKLLRFLQKLKNQNDPIVMQISEGKTHNLYYGDSSLLNKLKYYPVALLLIIFLFGGLVYNFYRSTKMATQNKLWAGMAKETAHQIGTPLSSLIGWLEIMKADNVAETTIVEIEKDITRLQTITDRFSKIGSEPILERRNIIEETEQSFDYLRSRFSKQVEFSFKAPKKPIMVLLNPALHSWTVENLVKNAIDAMKGRGKLSVAIESDNTYVKILVSDTGKGIPKNQFKRVFEPGFTTKRRGWGLGLSLTKRIVEEYHKGKIKVAHSEIDKGTTMQVTFKKA